MIEPSLSLPRLEVKTEEEKVLLDERFTQYNEAFSQSLNYFVAQNDSESAVRSITNLICTVSLPLTKKRKTLLRPTPWYSSICRQKKKQMKKAWRRYKNAHGTRELLASFARARNSYRRTLWQAKKSFFEKKRRAIEVAAKSKDLSHLWNEIKMSKRGSEALPSSITPNQWFNHFSTVLNHV